MSDRIGFTYHLHPSRVARSVDVMKRYACSDRIHLSFISIKNSSVSRYNEEIYLIELDLLIFYIHQDSSVSRYNEEVYLLRLDSLTDYIH
jgi:hypothetical protein